MRFGCAVSREPQTADAGKDLVEDISCRFPGPCDLALVFFTPHHIEGILDVLDRIREQLSPRHLLGCSGEGVIGADQEVERQPGISLLVGTLPGVRIQPFHISRSEWRSVLGSPARLAAMAQPEEDTRAWIVLGDPYTTPLPEALALIERASPGCPVVGGMASGGRPGQNVLVLNDRLITDGLVGATISGPVRVDTVVSQGCKPIGRPLLVTRADGNMIEELGGRPALETIQEVVEDLSPEDQDRLDSNLMIGVVINEYQAEFGTGDFLVRGILGADPETGAISIGDEVSVGQTVQFHLRDAAAADEEMRILMKRQGTGSPPAGGLVFSCNGRGTRMFSRPGHDVMAVLDAAPTTPLAGFFAAGELGPVGGRSFLHGHTASVVLFRPAEGEGK